LMEHICYNYHVYTWFDGGVEYKILLYILIKSSIVEYV